MPPSDAYQSLDETALRTVFRELDRDGDEHLDVSEIRAGLRRLRMPCTTADVLAVMQVAPDVSHPTIDFERFHCLVREREQRLQSIFSAIDTDGSGAIDASEFAASCRALAPGVTEHACHMALARLGRVKDARISFEEFRDALLLLPSLHVASVFDYWTRTAIDIGESVVIPADGDFATEQRRTFTAGAIAGAVSRTATAPLERLKVLLQVSTGQSTGLVAGLRSMYQEGGKRSFWRGNGANVVKIAPENGIRFVAFDVLKTWVAADPRATTVGEKLLCGALAGVIAQTTIYPLETIKTRLAVAKTGAYRGIIDCAAQMYRAEGARALYRGYLPSVAGIAPYCGVDLMVYNVLKEEYARRNPETPPGPLTLLACGTFSSCCGQVLAYPFALVRTRLQVQGAVTAGGRAYTGMIDCVRTTLREEGPRGLYRGLQANFLKALPAVAISYLTYEEVLKLL